MLRVTLRSLAARSLRLLLTATAIVLGVTFVTGTLILTDTSTRLFDDQFARTTAGVDLIVRPTAAFGSAMGVEVERDPVTDDVLDRIRRSEGVADVQGLVRGSAVLVVDGQAVVPAGPSIGVSWTPQPYNPFRLSSGRAPAGDDEVVIDQGFADTNNVAVGDPIAVSLEDGLRRFEVVGTAGFGEAAGIPNVTVALFAPATAQQLYGIDGGWSEVHVVADAMPAERLAELLTVQLGDGFEITPSRDVAAASAAAAQDQLLYLRVMLMAMAATALLVGAFMIANTFAIVVTQRTREFATLRALGAGSRQLVGSVLTEASALAVAASAAGVALGVAAATGLRSLAGALGVVIPDGPLAVTPRAVAIGLAVGIGVTLLSALVPARRASRTPPIAALRDLDASPQPLQRRRLAVGAALLASGLTALTAAALASIIELVALGGLSTTIGTIVLAPAVAGRLAAGVGRVPMGGVVTRLARSNLRRAQRRTATTSIALALGLAVVTYMTVVAGSTKAATTAGIDEVIQAELIVQSSRDEMLGGLSPQVHHHASEVPGVATASPMRFGHWQLAGTTQALTAVDPDTFAEVADLDIVTGDLAHLHRGGVLLADDVAAQLDVGVGDHLAMRFSGTGDQQLEIVGTFDAAGRWAVSTGYLISLDTFTAHFAENVDATVFLKLVADADPDTVKVDLEAALAEYPTATIYDRAEAAAARTRTLDSMLGLVSVLLVLTVLIALLGITNALALSIVERTREIGMLRAVGMSRSQVRWMVRTEAALTAVVGALTGTGLGIALAAAMVRAQGGAGAIALTIPAAPLATYLGIAALGGVLAGLLPGRRAANTPVLDAIAGP